MCGVAVSFCSRGLIKEFLGEDVLGDEDESAAKSAEDAEEITGEFDAAGEDDAHCKGDEGEICGGWVVNVEEEAVCENCKERGKAFNGVDKGDGDFLRCGGGEDVAADLEKREGQGGGYDVSTWVTNAVFERWNGVLQRRKEMGEIGEEYAPGGDKGELDESEGDRFRKDIEDGFGGSIGQGGAHVPDETEDLFRSDLFITQRSEAHTMSLMEIGAFRASAIS